MDTMEGLMEDMDLEVVGMNFNHILDHEGILFSAGYAINMGISPRNI